MWNRGNENRWWNEIDKNDQNLSIIKILIITTNLRLEDPILDDISSIVDCDDDK